MLRDPKVIEHLNTQLVNELTAVNQYFLNARILRHWGITKLGAHEYEESIEEMHHADWLIERILVLEGVPKVHKLEKVVVGKSVEEMLKADLALEEKACSDLRAGIADCEKVGDFVSRDLLARILTAEEEHADILEGQLDMIKRIGLERYIALNTTALGDEKSGD
jgi:bacterioferritin